jgi:hypothetical protein
MPKDTSSNITLTKGDTVFVPARIWPTEKPPKGEKGWRGQIVRENEKNSWVVSFKGKWFSYIFNRYTKAEQCLMILSYVNIQGIQPSTFSRKLT